MPASIQTSAPRGVATTCTVPGGPWPPTSLPGSPAGHGSFVPALRPRLLELHGRLEARLAVGPVSQRGARPARRRAWARSPRPSRRTRGARPPASSRRRRAPGPAQQHLGVGRHVGDDERAVARGRRLRGRAGAGGGRRSARARGAASSAGAAPHGVAAPASAARPAGQRRAPTARLRRAAWLRQRSARPASSCDGWVGSCALVCDLGRHAAPAARRRGAGVPAGGSELARAAIGEQGLDVAVPGRARAGPAARHERRRASPRDRRRRGRLEADHAP